MIEVLKQALDALETEVSIDWTNNDEFNASAEKMHDAITSLRQAILGLESQEPVAHRDGYWCADLTCKKCYSADFRLKHTTHPPQRTWQGLTDEEVKHEWEVWRANIPRYAGFAKGIEAKLKEKNS